MNQHTKGPWYRNINAGYPIFAGEKPNHILVAHVLMGDRYGITPMEAEANLRLIAAAPAMLDALEALVAAMTGSHATAFDGTMSKERALKAAREAINQAREPIRTLRGETVQ